MVGSTAHVPDRATVECGISLAGQAPGTFRKRCHVNVHSREERDVNEKQESGGSGLYLAPWRVSDIPAPTC